MISPVTKQIAYRERDIMKIELKGANIGIKLALKQTLLFPILVHRVDKTVHTYIRTLYCTLMARTVHWLLDT